MSRFFIYVLVGFFALISTVFARDLVEGIPDYVHEGTLVGTSTCDSGATKFSSYDVGDRGWGMTIAIDDKIRYYIFSPNPDSMSPITWTLVADASGNLKRISMQERNSNLKTEAPNLYALFTNTKNDCAHKKFSNQ